MKRMSQILWCLSNFYALFASFASQDEANEANEANLVPSLRYDYEKVIERR